MSEINCPHCSGTGKIIQSEFKTGDRVLWLVGGSTGTLHATVLKPSKTGQRIQIKTDRDSRFNAGYQWISYVSPKKLTLELTQASDDSKHD